MRKVRRGRRAPKETTTYAAFGKELTAREWSEDDCCVVSYGTLQKRLSMGWPADAALLLRADETRRGYPAFGESKSIVSWLADPRCVVGVIALKARLAKGETFEQAITRRQNNGDPIPFQGERALLAARRKDPRRYWAFGEVRTLNRWAADPRFGVNYPELKERVRKGMGLEAALLFETGELITLYWAFGERKRLGEWLSDPRCSVLGGTLKSRLAAGEMLESAMTRPVDEPSTAAASPPAFVRLTIGGETKTLGDWARDDRCEITETSLRERYKRGWPHVESILKRTGRNAHLQQAFSAHLPDGTDLGRFRTIAEAAKAIEGKGGVGSIEDRAAKRTIPIPRPKAPRRANGPRMITAWGETKSASDWVRDARCQVDFGTLVHRLDAKRTAWAAEDAISTPPKQTRTGQVKRLEARLLEAFGERKSAVEWAKDSRCEVTYSALRDRLRRGILLETALRRRVGPKET